MRRVVRASLYLFALLVVAWPLLGHPTLALADPLSELPVRLFVYERVPWFGGVVGSLGFPHTGPLNDPDPAGAAVTGVLRPIFGRVIAYNAWVLLNLALTLLATAALGRAVIADDRSDAPVFGAVAFTLTPLALVYGVSGAVVDLLALWPWSLCARSFILAWRRGRLRDHALAGVWAAVGFIASPYHLVVFTALAVPAAIGLLLGRGRPLLPDAAPSRLRLAGGFAAFAAALALAGPYVLHLRAVMADPTSQMSAAAVAASRHAWPFPLLAPEHTHRYGAFLSDYVAIGDAALIERVAASRFYRAFSPGFVLLCAAAAGLMLTRHRRSVVFWLSCSLFAALASTGPWLPLSADLHLSTPISPFWWVLRVLPGGQLLLEPFRYALPAVLALSVAGTIGVYELGRRFGGWVPATATLAWSAELILISPVPIPLQTSSVETASVYGHLDDLRAGALLELPYFDRGSDRFNRDHFLNQLTHGRPIAAEVLGFVPRYLAENQFCAALLHSEKTSGPLAVEVDPSRIDADRQQFIADGFALVVLTPARHRNPARVRTLMEPFGRPRIIEDGREIWVVNP